MEEQFVQADGEPRIVQITVFGVEPNIVTIARRQGVQAAPPFNHHVPRLEPRCTSRAHHAGVPQALRFFSNKTHRVGFGVASSLQNP